MAPDAPSEASDDGVLGTVAQVVQASTLPFTGSSAWRILLLGLVLLGAGVALVRGPVRAGTAGQP